MRRHFVLCACSAEKSKDSNTLNKTAVLFIPLFFQHEFPFLFPAQIIYLDNVWIPERHHILPVGNALTHFVIEQAACIGIAAAAWLYGLRMIQIQGYPLLLIFILNKTACHIFIVNRKPQPASIFRSDGFQFHIDIAVGIAILFFEDRISIFVLQIRALSSTSTQVRQCCSISTARLSTSL